jgi:hypothetical protein
MITHGFGSPAIVAALTSIQNYLNESIKYLDKANVSTANATGGSNGGGGLGLQCSSPSPLSATTTLIDTKLSYMEGKSLFGERK